MLTVNLNGQNHKLVIRHDWKDGFTYEYNPDTHKYEQVPYRYFEKTVARIYPENEPEMALEAQARFNPADNLNYAVGRKLALTRLTRQLDKHESQKVWEAVRNSGMKINVTIPRDAIQSRNS